MNTDDYIFKHYWLELPNIRDIKDACRFDWDEFALKMGCSVMTLWRWDQYGAHIPLEKRIKLKEIYQRYGR